MARVVVYTKRWCAYCAAAVHLLRKKQVAFEHVDVTGDRVARAWLAQRTQRSTVPQIFVDDQPIGGYAELRALERAGSFERVLGVIQREK